MFMPEHARYSVAAERHQPFPNFVTSLRRAFFYCDPNLNVKKSC